MVTALLPVLIEVYTRTRNIYKRVQAKEGNNPFQILTAAQIKQRNDSISKSKTKEGGALQVNWNKKLQAFIDFDGIPKKRDGTVGSWFQKLKELCGK